MHKQQSRHPDKYRVYNLSSITAAFQFPTWDSNISSFHSVQFHLNGLINVHYSVNSLDKSELQLDLSALQNIERDHFTFE